MVGNERDFDTPEVLVAHIQAQCRDGGPYVFRGTNRRFDKVSSGLFRKKPRHIFKDPRLLVAIEERIVDDARAHFPSGAANVDILTDLRHFGSKDTTLIDFSHNLLVALFFACNGEVEQNGTLIALPTGGAPPFPDIDYATRGTEIALLRPARTPLSRSRVEFQSSIFVHAPQGYIPKDSSYKSFCIPSTSKNACLDYLRDFHNIYDDTIYNDLIGFIDNKRNFEKAEASFDLGLEAQQAGKYHVAIKHYNETIRLKHDFAEAYNNRGNARVDLHHYKKAIFDYDEAIRFEPYYIMAYSNRGTAKAALERYEEAIIDFNAAIRLNPKYTNAYLNRGNAKKHLRDLKAAISNYDTAILLNPNFVEAYYHRGSAMALLRHFEDAIADLDEAIRRKPDYAEAYYIRGIAKRNLDRTVEARDDFQTALELAEKQRNSDLAELARRALSDLGD